MAYTPKSTTNIKTIEELRWYVSEELRRISVTLSETTELELRLRAVAPEKPREGMIVSADGVHWNPGSGAGAYEYIGGAWVKL